MTDDDHSELISRLADWTLMATPDRTYQQTHPWLTFDLDLSQAPRTLWMALGDVQSKCEQIAGVLLQPAAADSFRRTLLAKGALATTAIEGNTLTEDEVVRLLEGKLRLPRGKEHLALEVVNIVDACSDVLNRLDKGKPGDITVYAIADLNLSVLRGLPVADGVSPGQVRTGGASENAYHGARASECPELLERLCAWLNGTDFAAQSGFEIAHGVLKAIVAHLYITWIHPFGGGNGRTARLVEYRTMVAARVPSSVAHLLSDHYNRNRQEYYRQLQLASEPGSGVFTFAEYAARGLADGLREQLEAIREGQLDVAWRDLVNELLGDHLPDPAVRRRRRNLVLDLSVRTAPVPLPELRLITGRVAQAYATVHRKTFLRDLAALEQMGLVAKVEEGYEADKSQPLAFVAGRQAA